MLGFTDVYLEGTPPEILTQETNLGSLVAQANLAAAQEFDSAVVASLTVGSTFGGSIGVVEEGVELPPQEDADTGLPAGGITVGDVKRVLPQNDGLTLVTLEADDLLTLLEFAGEESGVGESTDRFLQVAGLSYSFDPDAREGERVRNVLITDEEGGLQPLIIDRDVVPGILEDGFRIVTLTSLADGAGGSPLADIIAADPLGAERVDLTAFDGPPGAVEFAQSGTEQDALAEFIVANHATPDVAFAEADTPASEDARIQRLDARTDGVTDPLEALREQLFLGNKTGADERFASDLEDVLRGQGGDDFLIGFGEDDILRGGGDEDVVLGATGDDQIWGRYGDDIVYGGAGDDIVKGNRGVDLINGGLGNDVLKGGKGADLFVWTDGNDVILDFKPGQDVLDISQFHGGLTFDAFKAGLSDTRGGIVYTDAATGETLTLEGVKLGELGQGDFIALGNDVSLAVVTHNATTAEVIATAKAIGLEQERDLDFNPDFLDFEFSFNLPLAGFDILN